VSSVVREERRTRSRERRLNMTLSSAFEKDLPIFNEVLFVCVSVLFSFLFEFTPHTHTHKTRNSSFLL
jgi:hypothetical protein